VNNVMQMPKKSDSQLVAWLAYQQTRALYDICGAASEGAEAAGRKAARRMSREDSTRYVGRRASQAVANEKYFEILDTALRAAKLAAARAAGYPSWAAFVEARVAARIARNPRS
jgi:hypothetical protein